MWHIFTIDKAKIIKEFQLKNDYNIYKCTMKYQKMENIQIHGYSTLLKIIKVIYPSLATRRYSTKSF